MTGVVGRASVGTGVDAFASSGVYVGDGGVVRLEESVSVGLAAVVAGVGVAAGVDVAVGALAVSWAMTSCAVWVRMAETSTVGATNTVGVADALMHPERVRTTRADKANKRTTCCFMELSLFSISLCGLRIDAV